MTKAIRSSPVLYLLDYLTAKVYSIRVTVNNNYMNSKGKALQGAQNKAIHAKAAHKHTTKETKSQASGEPVGIMHVKKVCTGCGKTVDSYLSK